MSTGKIVSILLFMIGILLIIGGGLYNPYAETMVLPPGGVRGIGFHMDAGETHVFEVNADHMVTVYVMDNQSFEKALVNGNFTDSLYVQTAAHLSFSFTAPKDGVYYIVIANFNSPGFVTATLTYGYGEFWALIITGAIVCGVAILILVYDIQNSKYTPPTLDSQCPYCGAKVSSTWNYCPVCRTPLRKEVKL